MFKMFEAVFFDWSGVISDDRPPVYEANMILTRWHGGVEVPFEVWLPNTLASAVAFQRRLGATGSDEELQELYVKALAEVKERGIHPEVYPDAKEVLELLQSKGIQIGVLSSHPESHLCEEASRYGLNHLLSLMVGDAKNKAQALRDILQQKGLKQEKVAYIGDMVFDVRAAKEAGVISVAVSTGYQLPEVLRESEPDYLFSRLADISELLTTEQI